MLDVFSFNFLFIIMVVAIVCSITFMVSKKLQKCETGIESLAIVQFERGSQIAELRAQVQQQHHEIGRLHYLVTQRPNTATTPPASVPAAAATPTPNPQPQPQPHPSREYPLMVVSDDESDAADVEDVDFIEAALPSTNADDLEFAQDDGDEPPLELVENPEDDDNDDDMEEDRGEDDPAAAAMSMNMILAQMFGGHSGGNVHVIDMSSSSASSSFGLPQLMQMMMASSSQPPGMMDVEPNTVEELPALVPNDNDVEELPALVDEPNTTEVEELPALIPNEPNTTEVEELLELVSDTLSTYDDTEEPPALVPDEPVEELPAVSSTPSLSPDTAVNTTKPDTLDLDMGDLGTLGNVGQEPVTNVDDIFPLTTATTESLNEVLVVFENEPPDATVVDAGDTGSVIDEHDTAHLSMPELRQRVYNMYPHVYSSLQDLKKFNRWQCLRVLQRGPQTTV